MQPARQCRTGQDEKRVRWVGDVCLRVGSASPPLATGFALGRLVSSKGAFAVSDEVRPAEGEMAGRAHSHGVRAWERARLA